MLYREQAIYDVIQVHPLLDQLGIEHHYSIMYLQNQREGEEAYGLAGIDKSQSTPGWTGATLENSEQHHSKTSKSLLHALHSGVARNFIQWGHSTNNYQYQI